MENLLGYLKFQMDLGDTILAMKNHTGSSENQLIL